MDEEEPRLGAPPARHVHAAVDEAAAREILSRGWLRSFLAHVRGAAALVRAERVWLPTYLVTIPMVERGAATRFQCSVDAVSGAFAMFAMPEAIGDDTPQSGQFPPRIGPQEADSIARAALVAAILRRRRKSATGQLGDTESVELLLWPYWVFYHRRRGGAMDIGVIDAATGGRVGHKIKLGVLDAFRSAARADAATKGT